MDKAWTLDTTAIVKSLVDKPSFSHRYRDGQAMTSVLTVRTHWGQYWGRAARKVGNEAMTLLALAEEAGLDPRRPVRSGHLNTE
jgi:hypothetical protein